MPQFLDLSSETATFRKKVQILEEPDLWPTDNASRMQKTPSQSLKKTTETRRTENEKKQFLCSYEGPFLCLRKAIVADGSDSPRARFLARFSVGKSAFWVAALAGARRMTFGRFWFVLRSAKHGHGTAHSAARVHSGRGSRGTIGIHRRDIAAGTGRICAGAGATDGRNALVVEARSAGKRTRRWWRGLTGRRLIRREYGRTTFGTRIGRTR